MVFLLIDYVLLVVASVGHNLIITKNRINKLNNLLINIVTYYILYYIKYLTCI